MKRFYSATINSLRAFAYGARHEAALREEMIALLLGLPIGLFIAPNAAWYVAMIGTLLVLLAVEFLNTAIEKLADHVTPDHHVEIRPHQGLRLGGGVLRDLPRRTDVAGGAADALGAADLVTSPYISHYLCMIGQICEEACLLFCRRGSAVASGDARVLERYLATKVAKRSRWAWG